MSSVFFRPTKNATALSANLACESKSLVTYRAREPVTTRRRNEERRSYGHENASPPEHLRIRRFCGLLRVGLCKRATNAICAATRPQTETGRQNQTRRRQTGQHRSGPD